MSTPEFKDKALEVAMTDPDLTHSEFGNGMHGIKIDCGPIEEIPELFDEWVDVATEDIEANYDQLPDILVSVANGTNTLVERVAKQLGVKGFLTEKDEASGLYLPEATQDKIEEIVDETNHALVMDDVGTTGSNTLKVARFLFDAGIPKSVITVQYLFQRRETLERLDEEEITYRSIFRHILPTYNEDECSYCEDGYDLRQYEQK